MESESNTVESEPSSNILISKFFGRIKCKIKRKIGSNSYELVDMDNKSLGTYSTDKFHA